MGNGPSIAEQVHHRASTPMRSVRAKTLAASWKMSVLSPTSPCQWGITGLTWPSAPRSRDGTRPPTPCRTRADRQPPPARRSSEARPLRGHETLHRRLGDREEDVALRRRPAAPRPRSSNPDRTASGTGQRDPLPSAEPVTAQSAAGLGKPVDELQRTCYEVVLTACEPVGEGPEAVGPCPLLLACCRRALLPSAFWYRNGRGGSPAGTHELMLGLKAWAAVTHLRHHNGARGLQGPAKPGQHLPLPAPQRRSSPAGHAASQCHELRRDLVP